MKRTRFIVIEKSYLIRKGIVSIINRIEKASVVCELESFENINSEINKHNPDFLVLNTALIDSSEKGRNSIIKFNISKKGIAIISQVQKENITQKFREKIYIEDEKHIIFEKIEKLISESYGKDPLIIQNELSNREITILKLVAKGLTNKEIADELFLSTHTVITHRKNITNKLGIKTISGLIVYAILNNIITLNDLNKDA